MVVSEDDRSCVITWNPLVLTLDDLKSFTSLLVTLHSEVAVPYVTSELYQDGSNVVVPPSPSVANVHMGSPLITQLLAGSNIFEIVSLGMVGVIVKKPERLSEFLPRLKEGWYRETEKLWKKDLNM